MNGDTRTYFSDASSNTDGTLGQRYLLHSSDVFECAASNPMKASRIGSLLRKAYWSSYFRIPFRLCFVLSPTSKTNIVEASSRSRNWLMIDCVKESSLASFTLWASLRSKEIAWLALYD